MKEVIRVRYLIPAYQYEGASQLFSSNKKMVSFYDIIDAKLNGNEYMVYLTFANVQDNVLDFKVTILLDGAIIKEHLFVFQNKEALLGKYLVEVNDDLDLIISLDLDVDLNYKYYMSKILTIKKLLTDDKDFLKTVIINNSLSDKLERIEFIYSVLYTKITTGKYGERGTKPELMANLNYMGYNNDYIGEITLLDESSMKTTDDVFENMLMYLLCNLHGSKKVKLPKDMDTIDRLYYLYFKKMAKECLI